MQTRILTILTRTPLHVGAGASVGAIDQPIIRERHTGFPIIPGSSLKGSLADLWNERGEDGKTLARVSRTDDGTTARTSAWLFGSDDANDSLAAAGALLFGEARLLAFPIRSARGSFAWITSPLLLRRAVRDGVLTGAAATAATSLPAPKDDEAHFIDGGSLNISTGAQAQVVLEEYTFKLVAAQPPAQAGENAQRLRAIADQLQQLAVSDPVWSNLVSRLVIVSDGQMSFFATAACEVAQHVRINDDTGTADEGGLFNQENVPADALFYAVVHATDSRLKSKAYEGAGNLRTKQAGDALDALETKLRDHKVVQFGADASTGLGYCSVKLMGPA